MLQEVGETILAVLLLHGSHALCDVEVGTILGIVVVADEIGQAVIQLADAHGLVDGQFHLLGHHHVGAECHHQQQQSSKNFSHLHNAIVKYGLIKY